MGSGIYSILTSSWYVAATRLAGISTPVRSLLIDIHRLNTQILVATMSDSESQSLIQTQDKPDEEFLSDLFYPILLLAGDTADDLLFLWTTCREVSRDFKKTVERVFLNRHLKYTLLVGCHGNSGVSTCSCTLLVSCCEQNVLTSIPIPGMFQQVQIPFIFSRVDPNDRTCAVFGNYFYKELEKPNMVKQTKVMFKHGNPSHSPVVIIHIGEEANDTALPDFTPDWDAMEFKVNWVKMYTEWFREHKEWLRVREEFLKQYRADGVRSLLVLNYMLRLCELALSFSLI